MAVTMTTPTALGGDGPSVTAGLLGLADPGLDDLKSAAVAISSRVLSVNQKPKMTHGLFFDDERGFKKVLTNFPKIRFGGKGREFDDLKLLIRHYEKWIRDLYPCDDNFEDLVWKARNLLQEKQKADDGVVIDPKERLHLLRFGYKTSGGVGLAGERAKAEATSAKQRKNEKISAELSKRKETDLDSETLWRIEEKRAKALELKRKRQADVAAAANLLGPASGPSQTSQTQSDVFGFGGGLDGSQSPAMQRPGAAVLGKTSSQSQQSQDDVFGFGGGMSQASSGAKSVVHGRPPSQASQRSMFSEQDVFGFGGNVDGSQASSIRSQASARSQTGAVGAPAAAGPAENGGQLAMGMPQPGVDIASQPVLEQSQKVLPEELLRKIEANRQRALEVQRRKREAEEASQGPQEPPDDLDVETLLKIEENRAKAVELRKRRQERRASQSQSQSSQSQSDVFGHGALSQSQASGLTQQSQLSQIAQARNMSQSQGSQQSQLSQIVRARNMSQSQASRGSQVDALASPASQISQDPAAADAGNAASSQAAQAHGWTATQDEAFFASQLSTSTGRGRRAAAIDASEGMDQDVFGFSFDDFDAFMDKPQATALEPGVVGARGTSSSLEGEAQQQTQPEAAADVAMSQPDVFGFGCDFDASQAGPIADAMVQPTPSTQAVVNPGSSQVAHTTTATAFAEISQATQLSAMLPPSALPVSKLRRAEVAVDTAERAPAPAPVQQEAALGPSLLPPSSARDEVAAMSQPDIFGFGFDMDASQAEPTSTTMLPSVALDSDISSPVVAGTVTPALETAPADVSELALPGLVTPEPAASEPLMAASQPDVFNSDFGMDASQAVPTSVTSSSQPGTNAVVASQQHADTEGPAVSQRDIFTFDCDFDVSQADGASQQGSRG